MTHEWLWFTVATLLHQANLHSPETNQQIKDKQRFE